MCKCKYCKKLTYLLDSTDEEVIGRYCREISMMVNEEEERECTYYTPPTQSDRIRNMTDEELADLFTSKTKSPFGKYHNWHGSYYWEEREDALKEELEWLQKPLEVDVDDN